MSRQAAQTNVSRGYLPGILNPPYAVERTPEYQQRVYMYAQNYFTPAEMQDLMRIGMRFVPQEAELIKRNLRRKGDFDRDVRPLQQDVHPSAATGNYDERDDMATEAANMGRARADSAVVRPLPSRDAAGYALGDPVDDGLGGLPVDRANYVATIPPATAVEGRTHNSLSFLRRTELFIASMFVFDAAHALLAHLHQEAVSLTSHGVDADERLLKQIVRNLRGYTFRRLVRHDARNRLLDGLPVVGRDGAGVAINATVDPDPARAIRIRDSSDVRQQITLRPLVPAVRPDGVDQTTQDFPEPFSTAELQQLRSQGWVLRDQKYWAPVRIPQMLAQYANGAATFRNKDKDVMLRAMNASVLDPSRFMGVYPVAFLTNTTLADDAVVARLIEHCNSATIDPMMFTWGMRRAVFMPLETDVADIALYSDVKTYDDLHETLNAFSNGLYEGLAIRGLWDGFLREKLAGLVTQVPVNQIGPFANVVKKIEVPATSETGGVRRTAGQEEVLRLWQKADDVLNLVNRWFLMGGNFGDVSYAEYRDPGTDPRKVLGNNAAITSWGARALGMNRCGPGYEEVWYDADPDTNPQANPQEPWLPDRNGELTVQNQLARVAKCAPVGYSASRIPDTGPDVHIDGTYPAYQRRAPRKHRSRRRRR